MNISSKPSSPLETGHVVLALPRTHLQLRYFAGLREMHCFSEPGRLFKRDGVQQPSLHSHYFEGLKMDYMISMFGLIQISEALEKPKAGFEYKEIAMKGECYRC